MGYSSLLETTYAGSGAAAVPIGFYGVLGGSFVYFSQAAQTSYNRVGDPTGSFTPNDLAAAFSYAQRFHGLLFGGTFKLIRSAVADASGATAAFDGGVQALHVTDAGDGALDLGGSVSNFGPPIKVGGASSSLPFLARAGLLWHTSPVINASLDVNLPVDQDPYVSFGVEGVLRQPQWQGFVRLGYNQAHTRDIDGFAGFTAGGGIDVNRFRLDYAWIPYGTLGVTNKVSIAFRF